MVTACRSDPRVDTLPLQPLGPRVEKSTWASTWSSNTMIEQSTYLLSSSRFHLFAAILIIVIIRPSFLSSSRHLHALSLLIGLVALVNFLVESRLLVGLGWFFCLVYRLQTASLCRRPHHLPSFLSAGLFVHRLCPSEWCIHHSSSLSYHFRWLARQLAPHHTGAVACLLGRGRSTLVSSSSVASCCQRGNQRRDVMLLYLIVLTWCRLVFVGGGRHDRLLPSVASIVGIFVGVLPCFDCFHWVLPWSVYHLVVIVSG
jgi:hypothetical protein